MVLFKKKHKVHLDHQFVEPDEVFLDHRNLPSFDTQQFEGRIEKPIKKQILILFFLFSVLVMVGFLVKLFNLQISKGEDYLTQSLQNALDREPIFAERGVIFDRNNVPLAWNEKNESDIFYRRVYKKTSGLGSILGYVQYPKKDAKGNYWRTTFEPGDGAEKVFNSRLSGVDGERIIEENVKGFVQSSNIVNPPLKGENITLSIDSEIQERMYKAIVSMAESQGYRGGAGLLMDVKTGELIAITSFPEYNSQIMTDGTDVETIKKYNTSSMSPFLNRAISGLYSPGSIIKPFVLMAALEEGVITPEKQILSRGSISIPNPYDPTKKSVFRDLHADNGWVDARHALAVSSNIYFYNVGGGYQSQKGLGIVKLKERIQQFGIAQKTGVELLGEKDGSIPDPDWKKSRFPDDPWRIGDTYNTSIGQYGFQVTPIEMMRAVTAIANKGKLLTPTILKDEPSREPVTLPYSDTNYTVAQEGMRLAVMSPEGTVKRLQNLPFKVAAKTGTAQVGARNEYINSWIIGFFPYEQPKYAFTILLEKGPGSINVGASSVALDFLSWLGEYKSEYTK